MEAPENVITAGSKCSAVTVKSDAVFEDCGAELLDEDRCRRWLIKKLHPGSITCPFCGTPAKDCQGDDLLEGKWVVCQACPKHYSAFTRTCLVGMHWTCREFVQLLLFVGAGWSAKRIANKLECSESAVRSWEIRITDRRTRSYVRHGR